MNSFDSMWADLEPIGRDRSTGGYRRYAWTAEEFELCEWFAQAAVDRGFTVELDRAGNQWAWRGDPDLTPGVVVGSHLDSVPDGGAFDGPLGVVSAFAAVDILDAAGFRSARPVGVVNFADEEGARYGVACAGSKLLTGQLTPERALALTDADGDTRADAMRLYGSDPAALDRDDRAVGRIASFVELHIEQGRGLVDLDAPVAVASAIRPHGRWRIDLPGEANHAGTTRLSDRSDAVLAAAEVVLAARRAAEVHDAVATCGKLEVEPNGVNAIASHATVWLDARAARPEQVHEVVGDLGELVGRLGGSVTEQSWSDATAFPEAGRLAEVLGGVPVLDTGAGHDAGILAQAGVPSAMLFVRNPTGVSHSPAEHAERDDCLAGVDALATVIKGLASGGVTLGRDR